MENSSLKARIGLSLNKNAVAELKKEIEIQFKDINVNVGINSSGSNSQLKTMIADLKEAKTRIQELENSQSKQSKNNSNRIASEIQMKKQLSDWNTKLQKQQLTHPEAFSGKTENSKKVIEDTEKLSVAMKNYEKNATKANKAMVGMAFNKLSVDIKKASTNTFSFSNMIQEAGKKFLAWMSVTQIAMQVIQGIKLMVDNVRELDTSLIELQKVSELTGTSLEKFVDKSYESASKLGRTGRELIDATTSFKRAGYNLQSSMELGKDTLLMKNVGDGIEDTAEASDVLIAALKGFNLEATDAESVIDKMNQVSNTSTASFKDLAEGVKLTSNSFAVGGDGIDEMNGMLVAANSSLRDMSKAANGVKTIGMRLRGISTDADDVAPSLTNITQKFKDIAGIDMFDSTGQIKAFSKVTDELSVKWDGLSKNQKSALAEIAGGKRQGEIFLGLMNNYDEKIKATSQSMNSMGSAQKENAKYMNSIEAHVKSVSSAFQELSKDSIDSSLVKNILKIVEAVIKMTNKIGGFNVVLGAGLMLLQHFKKAPAIYNNISASITKMAISMGVATTTATVLGAVLTAGLSVAAVAAISAITDIIDKQTHSVENQKQKYQDVIDTVSELQTEYDSLSSKTNKTELDREKLFLLEKQLDVQKALATQEEKKTYNTTFKGDVSFLDKLTPDPKVQKIINNMDEGFSSLTSGAEKASQSIKDFFDDADTYAKKGEGEKAIQSRIEGIKALKDANYDYREELNNTSSADGKNAEVISQLTSKIDENNSAILEQYDALRDYKEQLNAATEHGYGNTQMNQALSSAIEKTMTSIESLTDSTGNNIIAVDETANANIELSNVYDTLKSSMDLVIQAQTEQDNNGYLSIDTVMKMIDAGTEYSNLLSFQNGQFQLQGDAVTSLFEIKKAEAISNLQMKQDEIKMQIEVSKAIVNAYSHESTKAKLSSNDAAQSVKALGNITEAVITALGETSNASRNAVAKAVAEANKVANATGGLENLGKDIPELEKSYSNLGNLISNISSMTLPQFTASANGAAKATNNAGRAMDNAKESTKALEAEIDKLKDTIDGFKDKLGDAKDKLDETKEAYELFQKAIENQLEKEINALEKKLDLIAETKKEYEMMQKLAQEQLQKEMDEIQKKMDALDEEKEKEDDILRLQEAQLNVKKAQDALENAKQNKDTRVYSEGEGWKWEANPSDVKDASGALEDALKTLTELQKEYELAKKKADLQGQMDELQKLADAWGTNMEDIHNSILDHESVVDFMNKFEKASNDERKAMLEDYTRRYGEEIVKNNATTQTEIDKLKELKEQWSKSMDIQADLNKYAGMVEALKRFENGSYEQRKAMLGSFTRSWNYEFSTQTNTITGLENKIAELEGKLKGMQNSLSNTRSSIGSAQGDLDRYNATPMYDKHATNYTNSDTWENVWIGNKAYSQHRINGTVVSSSYVGQMFDESGSNPTFITSSGNHIMKYADGGVDSFGSTGVVDWTGKTNTTDGRTVQLDGTQSKPEVVLNNEQASRVLYMMANNPVPSKTVNNNNTAGNKTVIQNVNVYANNNTTFERIIQQAEQQSKVNR